MDDNYLAFHPHLLIDREPTLGKREHRVSEQVKDMFREIMSDIKAARERAAEEAETE